MNKKIQKPYKKKFKEVKLTMKMNLEVATMKSLLSNDFSETEVEIVEQLEEKPMK